MGGKIFKGRPYFRNWNIWREVCCILSLWLKKNNQIVYTIDHHRGSEEHQLGEEYFDQENFDEPLTG